MLIQIKDKYKGVGYIDISLAHNSDDPSSKQGLNTILRLTGDASTYIKALSGINEDGCTYLDLELQGVESIGALKVLYDSIGALIRVVENNKP